MGVIPDNRKALLVGEGAWWGGTVTPEAQYAEEAIKIAGLDYEVEAVQAGAQEADGSFTPYENKFVIRRSSDRKPYMIASDHYTIVQPAECFAFADELVKDHNVRLQYETAGAMFDGAVLWLAARLPETLKIAGDDVVTYIFLRQTFDGSGCLMAGITPQRIVCDNTLTLAVKGAKRSAKMRHTGDMTKKIEQAKEVLRLHKDYTVAFQKEAERLLSINIAEHRFDGLIETLLPYPKDATQRIINGVDNKRCELRMYMDVPDLANVRSTGWGFYNAVSDLVCHGEAGRKTQTEQSNRLVKVLDGHDVLQRAHDLILAYN